MGFWRIRLPRRRIFHQRNIFLVLLVAISSSLPFIVHLLLYCHPRRAFSDPAKPQLALSVLENSARQQTPEVVSMGRILIPLPACPYNPSFLVRGKIPKYGGWWRIKESLVFPQDDTDMLSRGSPWSWFQPSPLINKTRLESIVHNLMTSLRSR